MDENASGGMISKDNADRLVEVYRILSGMRAVEKNSVLMFTWATINNMISQALQYGGWRFYFDPRANRMEIEERK